MSSGQLNVNGQPVHGKPGFQPSSARNGRAILDEWSANRKLMLDSPPITSGLPVNRAQLHEVSLQRLSQVTSTSTRLTRSQPPMAEVSM